MVMVYSLDFAVNYGDHHLYNCDRRTSSSSILFHLLLEYEIKTASEGL
jgi:hypothetical protein